MPGWMWAVGKPHLFPMVPPLPDNALVTQSRVIMLDSMAILFTFLSVLFYLKFCNCQRSPHAHAHTHTTLLPRTNIPVPLPAGRGLDDGTCTSFSVRVRWDACWGELHSGVGHTPLLTPPLSQWQYQVYRHPWNGVPGVCGPGGPVPAGGRQVCASARVPRPLPAEGLRSGGGSATDEHHALLRSLFSDDTSRHP